VTNKEREQKELELAKTLEELSSAHQDPAEELAKVLRHEAEDAALKRMAQD
jgi:hypothetical protein